MERQSDLFQEIKDLSQKEYEGTLTEEESERLNELRPIRDVEILSRLHNMFLVKKDLHEEFLKFIQSGVIKAFTSKELLQVKEVENLDTLHDMYLIEKNLHEEFFKFIELGLMNAFINLFEVDVTKRGKFEWQQLLIKRSIH